MALSEPMVTMVNQILVTHGELLLISREGREQDPRSASAATASWVSHGGNTEKK
jgi:hypothetical protein